MKAILFLVAVSLISISSQAQWSYRFLSHEKHFFYSSGDYIVGNQNGGKISVNYVYNNKYTVNIGYSATTKNEAQLPNEILKSATELIPANSTVAFSNSENIHLMLGRVFNLNKEGTFRFILQGGPGMITSRDPIYTVKSNVYEYDMEATKKMCMVLNPKFEIPLFSALGVSAGPMLVMNNSTRYIGAGIGIMYGIVGKE
ncbi:MAG TPA: hypothetical protein PK335_04110 [Draconibacterium sp.]|nr:hypothetical protein [Draconibacterium sp.]